MSDERTALERRMATAADSCTRRKCTKTLARFQGRVQKSRAVLCRPIGAVLALMASDDAMYASFYDQVRGRMRRPEETVIDQERLVADALLFPHYQNEICFAALSIDGNGVSAYGGCSMVLADEAIKHRATVFEKNSLEFCRERKLGVGNPLPAGYRASWKHRATLAAAKLHESLDTDTDPNHFPKILLNDLKRDFVEVHIFGPLHRRSFEAINVTGFRHPSDEALLLEIERRADEVGVGVTRS